MRNRDEFPEKWKHRSFFQSDIWANIYVVFIGHSQFLTAKPIKPTVFKNSAIKIAHLVPIS